MTNIPDWPDIANDLIANAIWASPFVGWYVWNRRKKIAAKLRWLSCGPILQARTIQTSSSSTVELTTQTIRADIVPADAQVFAPTVTVGKSIDLKRLADEGLEFALWCLRHA